MDHARSLHSVFTDLTGERDYAEASGLRPDEVLAAGGHPDLPEGLVAEAVVNYADTAPYEVAEHLAPYVRANSAVPQPVEATGEPEPHWYDLLTTAPPVAGLGGPDVLDAEASALAAPGEPSIDAGASSATADFDLDAGFGHGHRGPAEDLAHAGEPGEDLTSAGEPGDDAAPLWSATTTPPFDSEGLGVDAGIDFGPRPGEGAAEASGDEPDAIDEA